jgi:lactaldehyde dehydrogenase/glycolaldehyde dehydrogenase
VVAGILPWNFPFFLIARKAGAALIAGCTIVIKPSQLTPENCTEFAKIVDESGLPAGVINIVTGKGSVIGNEMAGSPKIDIVSVTGSVGAGESIMAAASKNITKVSLELGGKAPAIVMKDADLERAAQWIVDSRIGNNGQICNNAERVYVQKEVKEAFTKILVDKMSKVRLVMYAKMRPSIWVRWSKLVLWRASPRRWSVPSNRVPSYSAAVIG